MRTLPATSEREQMSHATDVALAPFEPKEGENWGLTPAGISVRFALSLFVPEEWFKLNLDPALHEAKRVNRMAELVQQLQVTPIVVNKQLVALGIVVSQPANIPAVHEILKGLLESASRHARAANEAIEKARDATLQRQEAIRQQTLEAFKKLT
jgi:hypothetical protein